MGNKEIKDLRDLEQYNPKFSRAQQHNAEEAFDTLYRTPQNASIDLLKPKEFAIAKEGDESFLDRPRKLGNYDSELDKITIRDQDYINTKVTSEQAPFFTQERVLIHENVHKKQEQRRRDFEMPRVRSEYNYYKEMDTSGKQSGLKEDLRLFNEQLKRSNVPLFKENKTDFFLSKPEEFPALYTQLFPERIINPKSSLDRKINRLWFD